MEELWPKLEQQLMKRNFQPTTTKTSVAPDGVRLESTTLLVQDEIVCTQLLYLQLQVWLELEGYV